MSAFAQWREDRRKRRSDKRARNVEKQAARVAATRGGNVPEVDYAGSDRNIDVERGNSRI